jgi:hypothetical protein
MATLESRPPKHQTYSAMKLKTQSEDFAALWCFIGGRLNLYDDDAKSMALRLMAKGITTWEQWVNAGEVIA